MEAIPTSVLTAFGVVVSTLAGVVGKLWLDLRAQVVAEQKRAEVTATKLDRCQEEHVQTGAVIAELREKIGLALGRQEGVEELCKRTLATVAKAIKEGGGQ